MAFRAHEHLFRRVPAVIRGGICRHESFITPHYDIVTGLSYTCEICKEVTMKECEVDSHCAQNPHVSRVHQIQRMQQNPSVVQMAALQHRIEKLGLCAWQYEVQSKLYWILLYDGASNNDGTIAAAVDCDVLMYDAETLLLKFEYRERLALLELAVWKAVCIAISENASEQKDYHSWQNWVREGWKENKITMRDANEIGITVASVSPFLGSAETYCC